MQSPTRKLAIACVCLSAASNAATSQTTRPASGDDVARLIAGLANRSYQKREQIARRIAEVGPAAIPHLRRQINNPKQEIALAARELMAELEEVFFCGVSIRLEVDPPRVRWNQPVRVRVTAENHSPFDAKVPWETGTAATTRPASIASTVGLMLDVGEFLQVTSPNDEPLDLRVDPIGDDRGVEATVNERLAGGPVSTLAPGQSCVIELLEFNRAWARFPLLAKGVYRIQFVYQPEWSRNEWIETGLGNVASNAVEIEVVEPAPPAVRKATQPIKVLIAREEEQFVARLVSTWDRPVSVNLNFGADTTRYAQVTWSVRPQEGEGATVTRPPIEGAAPDPVDPARIRTLQPEQKVEIARIDAAILYDAVRKQAPDTPADKLNVAARYTNYATREDLREISDKDGRPPDASLREWVERAPYPVLTAAPSSRPLPLVAPAATTQRIAR